MRGRQLLQVPGHLDHGPLLQGYLLEAQVLADLQHGRVPGWDQAVNPLQTLGLANGGQLLQELCAQAVALVRVLDDQAELCCVAAMRLDQPPHSDHQRCAAAIFAARGGDHRHLAVVVDEGQAGQPLVRHVALPELQHAGHAPVGLVVGHHLPCHQALVELLQQRLVFRADGTDQQRLTIASGPLLHVLSGVWADGRLWEASLLGVHIVQYHTCIECQDSILRRQERIDVHFLDPGLLNHNLAETHHQLLHQHQIGWLLPSNPTQGLINLCLLHHAASQSGCQWRQTECAVLVDLDQGSALTEEQHRAKLWIHAAAENDFVAVELLHRLHADAMKMLLAYLLDDA
mmetsp:Transcript_36144/g.103964  ORF Transcript_36144/g.103964 Transcript_36144/m.103964 type:complete len:345 (+) Transcript_36144:52-1086(+)